MTNFPEVFELKNVADIATKLGFNTPMLKRTKEEEEQYFKTFDLEIIEKEIPQGKAKLEIASYKGEDIAAIAYLGGNKQIIPINSISDFKAQLKN